MTTSSPAAFPAFDVGCFSNISIKPIGSGRHKTVHSATYTGPDTTVVCNGDHVALLYFKDDEPMVNEYKVMMQIRAPHLAKFYGSVLPHGQEVRLCLVSEFAARGALSCFFDQAEDDDIMVTMANKLVMARQAGEGLASLHEHDLVHADVAARNVLVYTFDASDHHRTHVKLSDYGLVRERSKYTGFVSTEAGGRAAPLAPKWASWESLKKDKFYRASDVWSFGVLVWEILTEGDAPYQGIGNTMSAMIQHLSGGHRLSKPPNCPDILWAVISQCWRETRKERPSLRDVLAQLSHALERVAAEAAAATAKAQLKALQTAQQAWTKAGFGWRADDIALSPALDAELQYRAHGPLVGADPRDAVTGGVAEKLANAIEKLATLHGGCAGHAFKANVDSIVVVKNQSLIDSFNGRLARLHELRQLNSGTSLFNGRWDDGAALPSAELGEKRATYARLERFFVDTDMGSNSSPGAKVALMWHGVPSDAVADAIFRTGLVSNQDEGHFGKGVYLTPEAEYAAFYANGQAPPKRGATYTLLLCAVCLANPYPLTRGVDYDPSSSPAISKFH
jgi:serine/threonine protein kinase